MTDSDMDPNLNAAALEAISGAMLPNGYLLILCKGGTLGYTSVSFGLGSSESLYLYYYNGTYYSLVDSISWSEHQTSGGLVPDGNGTWNYPLTYSPGTSN